MNQVSISGEALSAEKSKVEHAVSHYVKTTGQRRPKKWAKAYGAMRLGLPRIGDLSKMDPNFRKTDSIDNLPVKFSREHLPSLKQSFQDNEQYQTASGRGSRSSSVLKASLSKSKKPSEYGRRKSFND